MCSYSNISWDMPKYILSTNCFQIRELGKRIKVAKLIWMMYSVKLWGLEEGEEKKRVSTKNILNQ